MTSALFSPIALRELTLGNRIVVSPMCQYSAIDGRATDWHLVHWGQLLMSGAGMFTIEATAVTPEGLPERRASIADHDQRAGVRDARSDRAARRHGGVVARHIGRPDQIEPLRNEPFPQLREKDRHALTSSAPLAYVVRSAPTTL